nr:MAG TPA_asm: lipoprotein [Caudoviricetes sp.]
MKKIVLGLVLASLFIGCSEKTVSDTSTKMEAKQQEELSKQAIMSVGLPNISNFYEKKTLKKIIEMRDNPKLVNYLYTRNDMTGKWIYEGKCIGFGIPYTTQYTNPEKMGTVEGGEYGAENPYTLPQADPNGLYSVPNGTATWVIKVGDKGQQTIEYIESEIRVTQEKLDKRLVETWSLTKDY